MSENSQTKNSPAAFFAVTFMLAAPLYILNALAYLEILGGPALGPLYIALCTFTPVAAASLLTLSSCGRDGLKQLIRRIFDFRRIVDRRWYAVIVLLPLLVSLFSLGGAVLFGTQPSPAAAPFIALPILLPFFFVLAAGEEAGWMGHAFDPIQAKYGAFRAAILLGAVWAIWHVPFFVFMLPDVIVFQFVALVSTRVLIAWVYNNTHKSVFAAILFHAMGNALLIALPNTSHAGVSGPAVSSGLLLLTAFAATLLWGPRTLSRYRYPGGVVGDNG